MIDGTYFVEVDTPLGRKSGTVDLVTHGDVLEACVKAPIIGKQEATGTVDGDTFSAEGSLKIPFKGTQIKDRTEELSESMPGRKIQITFDSS